MEIKLFNYLSRLLSRLASAILTAGIILLVVVPPQRAGVPHAKGTSA
jgi:hypothetical protein